MDKGRLGLYCIRHYIIRYIDYRSIRQLLLLLPATRPLLLCRGPSMSCPRRDNGGQSNCGDILWATGNMLEKSISEISFPQQSQAPSHSPRSSSRHYRHIHRHGHGNKVEDSLGSCCCCCCCCFSSRRVDE